MLWDIFQNVFRAANFTLHPSDTTALQDAFQNHRFIGNLLVEAVLLSYSPLRWYDEPIDAIDDLPNNFHRDIFTEVVKAEERTRQDLDINARLLEAMHSFLNRFRQLDDASLIVSRLNDVYLSWRRGLKTGEEIGYESGIPRKIIGHLSASKSMMPAASLEDLMADLTIHHGDELEQLADSEWAFNDAYRQVVSTELQQLRNTARQPWATSYNQESLWA